METKNICKWYNVCPLKKYFEKGKLDIKWINEYYWGNYQHRKQGTVLFTVPFIYKI
jgi:hypothetical protein